jgi:hypothetical protein
MGSLIFVLMLCLLMAVVMVGDIIRQRHQRVRLQRIREQARLRAVESQVAALRAALRISVAEHVVRRAMATQGRDLFENRTDHEEYRAS